MGNSASNNNEREVALSTKEQNIETDRKFYRTEEMVETAFKFFERYKSDYIRIDFDTESSTQYNILRKEMASRFNGLRPAYVSESSERVLSNKIR